ncbi:Get3/ArsA fold putative tail anchor-mediating ATPase NosAFP [Leptothoe sp. PORK10 BA2]|uniref:Get3/ArsA fold putative tail anchor-mediating ATPase NosAFP n=1 Tax=Leptothoe sp. PORK10 BA2 TaxID=3110254 RepID=UPI002B1EF468|nr:ArsA family ATPase [Leptothoe sp. PORK10 BA2]MEA5462125.1 ArsA family ATPase [Leptothoe sp. PORK10 BA2]
MALILTFLGKGGSGRSTCAIATAKKLSAQGQRVLLVTEDAGPGFGLLLGHEVASIPTPLGSNLWCLQLKFAQLLEQNWEQLKKLEAEYLRDPFFKAVYGQELSLLPGMDQALTLNALREYDASGDYDVIVHDGPGNQASLRMWGMPAGIDWYFRRFKQVFQASQFSKAVMPFVQPLAGAVLSGGKGLSGDLFNQPEVQQSTGLVGQGIAAVKDPMRVRAYLVSSNNDIEIATARYLWGAAQQIELTVAGVLLNRSPAKSQDFEPLPVYVLPAPIGDWQSLMASLPDYVAAPSAPAPVEIDLATNTVRLFLPSLDKKQIQLTQYGPEVTIEAGDQRRNLTLPKTLQGRSVTGAKFQSGYLILSFG